MDSEWFHSLWRSLLEPHPLQEIFRLPAIYGLGGVFFFALTGALAAIRRGYDFVGLFILAFVTGVGGALIRDGLFIQQGPPAIVVDARYIIAVVLACFAGVVIGGFIERFQKTIAYVDALGLGAYAVVGVQTSLAANLSIAAAIMIGTVNAVGGGLLRDIIVRVEPLMLKPGQFYVLAALLGSVLFVGLILDGRLWRDIFLPSLDHLVQLADQARASVVRRTWQGDRHVRRRGPPAGSGTWRRQAVNGLKAILLGRHTYIKGRSNDLGVRGVTVHVISANMSKQMKLNF